MVNPKLDKNFDYFLKTDLSKYRGNWVAIHNNTIKTHSKSLKRLITRLGLSKEDVLFTYVPKKALYILRKA